MANALDNAIGRIQDIALSCTDTIIKSAPDFPIENADACPFVITHLAEGDGWVNASTLQFMPVVNADFYFNRVNLKQAYQQSDAVALEFLQRLAGDPTLNGLVDTIQIGRDDPVHFSVAPDEYGSVVLQKLQFSIRIKVLSATTTT